MIPCRVAVVEWTHDGDAIGEAIYQELHLIGHEPVYFPARAYTDFILTGETDLVLLFGPFGKFLPILEYVAQMPLEARPLTLFWNTEGFPNPRIPWPIMRQGARIRSWIGRHVDAKGLLTRMPVIKDLFSSVDRQMMPYRHLGDFLHAQYHGLIDVYADVSAVYGHYLRRKANFDPVEAPLGSSHRWYTDLGLERDIDVIWIGKRETKRVSSLLEQIQKHLSKQGVQMLLIDDEKACFRIDEERIRLLNRSKINLNILSTWHDENSLEISIAASNRSLVVSEPLLPHVLKYEAGVHYVSSPIAKLADTIIYYLEHDNERDVIIKKAYQLMTTELSLYWSVQRVMNAVELKRFGSEMNRSPGG
ncbi:MAG: hypothetical protein AAF702_00960 [Chloroflexota bacterium]